MPNKHDPTVWFQTSRRFRTLAKLPEGKTGLEAMRDTQAPFATEKWLAGAGEGAAGEHYLRCYAPKKDTVELSREDFQAWQEAGGTTYVYYCYGKERAAWESLAKSVLDKAGPAWKDRRDLAGDPSSLAHRTQPSHHAKDWLASLQDDVLLIAYPTGLWQQFRVVPGHLMPALVQCGWAEDLAGAVLAAEVNVSREVA